MTLKDPPSGTGQGLLFASVDSLLVAFLSLPTPFSVCLRIQARRLPRQSSSMPVVVIIFLIFRQFQCLNFRIKRLSSAYLFLRPLSLRKDITIEERLIHPHMPLANASFLEYISARLWGTFFHFYASPKLN